MYDPDEPKSKPVLGNLKQEIRPTVQLMSRKDHLRFYLVNDSGYREKFGFGMSMTRRLIIKDKSKLEKIVDPELKDILRELYMELK